MTHAWCHDIARDAAVRAAEDNRNRPLPTLAEAIAAPFACTACGGFGMDHRCKESCDQCDGSGRAMIPKSGSASSAVDHENKGDGMATDGLRTERVTLEITHDGKHGPVSTWPFECGSYGKGVRVVEEACPDAWAQTFARLEAERDAAIRERQKLEARVAELEGCSWVPKAERDALQARVTELEAASGGGEGEGRE